ncbi:MULTISPECIES: GNAT family N-acetyltransferase [Rhizobium/Agrobacterium group]|uniref:GNAT family N-acetyltransferase n=1 Tax=Rhizobium/Agrobacterium group TaxID=227290 RepID=UPI0012E82631|nr:MULTISPECIES: GNAT family N-acetyltransferase [Rhizobium/Agrobacterium group]MCF1471018.1 GNAT family N-acetyltransferase [Allorhizobium ampelinum]MVA50585.1 GNAT family N-acetyltransferase [Agrobacterium vitis]NSZ53446.1 GNAT family N-acetyltransferase [Agrobacterium vitis]NTA32205.1 GNAT family N-acetyltransferase [Agrobacterium vitis]
MFIRPATSLDAQGMSDALNEIFASGLRKSAGDPQLVLANYIEHKDRIECSVAQDDDGRIFGFQSLRFATADNPYGTPEGWGIIGTHISPLAARRGIGSALLRATLQAAKSFSLDNIEAAIGADNEAGLAYYEAMGFRTYRSSEVTICKVYRIEADAHKPV